MERRAARPASGRHLAGRRGGLRLSCPRSHPHRAGRSAHGRKQCGLTCTDVTVLSILCNRGIEPQHRLHGASMSPRFTPGGACARLNLPGYRLPQTISVFQFNSWILVSNSRNSLDSWSICFRNSPTGTVATNFTSDFEYRSWRVPAASATCDSKSLLLPAASRSAMASETVLCPSNEVLALVRLMDFTRSINRLKTRSTACRSSVGSSAGCSPSCTLAHRPSRFFRSSIRLWQSPRSASASAIFKSEPPDYSVREIRNSVRRCCVPFMTMPSDPNWYVGAAWTALLIVWVVAAFRTKRDREIRGRVLTRLRSFCILVNP